MIVGEKMRRPPPPRSLPPKSAVIQRKLRPPPLAERIVVRRRLDALLGSLIERHRVVVVSATAGAGKTTAVIEATRASELPTAWLTLDRTDAMPGRLIAYLEAAISRVLPELGGIAMDAVASGVPHAEAAGLLADAVAERPLLLVIDDLERLGSTREPWAVVESLLRHLPEGMRCILVSRRDIPAGLCELPSPGTTAWLSERDLAFTTVEAARALEQHGDYETDALAAVEATGGWVTGVLFDAWRSSGHIVGADGEADPLYGYLSTHILSQLPPESRRFLVTTSLLDEVNASSATALGESHAAEHLLALRSAHLPVSWEADGRTMRCHARFREYLIECLQRRDEDEVRELRLRYGRLLAASGHDEDATEEFLAIGALSEALDTAERAIMPIIERLDLSTAERWLEALTEVAPRGSTTLTSAELMLAWAREDYRRGVRIADELASLDELGSLAGASALAAALMAWCYIICGRPLDASTLLATARHGAEVDAVRYVLEVSMGIGGDAVAPELTGSPFDAVVLFGKYWGGSLPELQEAWDSPWVDSVTAPWRIAALRASGRTTEALELYEAAQAAGAATLVLYTIVAPDVLLDAGRVEEARAALARAWQLARQSGARGFEVGVALTAAKFALRLDADPAAARAALDRLERHHPVQRVRQLRAIVDTWYGFALLMEFRDVQALTRLRRATSAMREAGHPLELPSAAVYLAEAEWRAGHEEAADRAIDLALDAAREQGSNNLLLQALADFPAVLSRRLDAEPAPDSPWHEIGRALIAQGVSVSTQVRTSVHLQEFGEVAILVDGVRVRPGITKSVELLAYLASRPRLCAERDELIEVLFDGRHDDSTSAYLRQALRRLRQALPEGVLVVEHGSVRFGGELAVVSESAVVESSLVEAARLQGDDRLAATLKALECVDRGEYLPEVRSPWCEDRRRWLGELVADARYEAAAIALSSGRYAVARSLCQLVLDADPLREAGWRLFMRIANALGDEDGVIAAYRECEHALSHLSTTPSGATQELLKQLRR
jgi:ATP/maltotriose-dependent transcriptional regulator MalT/DNA-binding SARP family transcriptional activator